MIIKNVKRVQLYAKIVIHVLKTQGLKMIYQNTSVYVAKRNIKNDKNLKKRFDKLNHDINKFIS